MTKLIGITGGIGAGKTMVCKLFSMLRIPFYNADEAAKNIVEIDQEVKSKIIQLLGNEAYIGIKYNRKYVAKMVYSNFELLEKLNAIIHPKVRQNAVIWLQNQKKANYYLYEAALMNAAGDGNFLEKVIVVNSPMQLRINRIKSRDGRNEAEILAIMKRQITDEERLSIADFVIENDEKNSIIQQVMKIHNQILHA
jgi:dephospho-CoA kinase